MEINLKSIVENRIILDKDETWPNELKLLFTKNKEIIKNYLFEDVYIHEGMRRYEHLHNKYQNEFIDILNASLSILKDKKLIAFHISRLHNKEINYIKANGLLPTNEELYKTKLDFLIEENLINEDEYKILSTQSLINDEIRKNKIYCFLTTNTFNNNSYGDLGDAWGGEVIYRSIDVYENIKKIKSIGEKCIVICEINDNEITDKFLSTTDGIIMSMMKVFLNIQLYEDIQPKIADKDIIFDHKIDVLEVFKINENDKIVYKV